MPDGQPSDAGLGKSPGFLINVQQVLQPLRLLTLPGLQAVGIDRVDLVKPDTLIQKCLDGHLIGGIEHGAGSGRGG